jgi:xylulokinase
MSSFLGVDLGTSSVRGAVVDLSGSLLRSARRGLKPTTGESGGEVVDPDDWVSAVRELLDELAPFDAFSIGGQMNGYVAVDERGTALVGGLTWLDRRLIARESHGGGSAAPVVRFMEYLINEEPAAWQRTRWLLLPKDYVLLHALGRPVSDRLSWNSILNPSTTGFSFKDSVPPEVRDRVPTIEEMTSVKLSNWGPVVAGCPDSIAGLIGCGIDRDRAYLLSGTSETVATFAESAQPSHGIRATVPLADSWIHVGSSSAGGSTLSWATEALGFGTISELVDAASQVEPARAPLFTPYLTGERAPIWDSGLTAGWSGVRSYHRRSHLAYAVVESIVFATRRLLQAVLKSANRDILAVRANGRAFRTAFLRLLSARVLGCPLEIVDGEAGAVGAAMIALAGTQSVDLEAVSASLVRHVTEQQPIRDEVLASRFIEWSELGD